jgi:hypothetical protein
MCGDKAGLLQCHETGVKLILRTNWMEHFSNEIVMINTAMTVTKKWR